MFGLFPGGFLDLEQVVQTAFFDGLEECGGNVHVCIENLLAGGEFGQGGDGGFQVGGVGRQVDLGNVVDVGDPRRPRHLRRLRLVLAQIGVNVFRHGRERVPRVFRPEKVFRVHVVGFLGETAVFGGRDGDSVEFHVEDVGYERLVCPRVGEHRDEVNVSVHDDKHCAASLARVL